MGWRFSPHLLASSVPLLITALLIGHILGSRVFNYQKNALILSSGRNLAGVVDATHIKDLTTSVTGASVFP